MNPFFDDLGRRLGEAAAREGVAIEAPTLDGDVARELLELARVAAHTQERRFAPLATYLTGIAVGRLGSADPAAVARLVRTVREELEKEASASEPGSSERG